MKWCQIQTDYPDQFVLLKNYRTEPIDDNHFRVTEGDVVATHTDYREIQNQYQQYRVKGVDVIFCLPRMEDFIVETAPMMGFLNDDQVFSKVKPLTTRIVYKKGLKPLLSLVKKLVEYQVCTTIQLFSLKFKIIHNS